MKDIRGFLPFLEIPDLPPRYNICPTQEVAAVLTEPGKADPLFGRLRWGFLANWAKSPKEKLQPINAKSETVAEGRMFRKAFESQRCLILADGFYEWAKAGERKQPYYIRLKDDQPFAFAGLRSHWEGGEKEVIDSCTILTTEPNDLTRTIHNRMPVILDSSQFRKWLDPGQGVDALTAMMQAYPAEKMEAYPVSLTVNNPRNTGPQCMEPLA
jgi:putative SOS response-associated peptidase YedK